MSLELYIEIKMDNTLVKFEGFLLSIMNKYLDKQFVTTTTYNGSLTILDSLFDGHLRSATTHLLEDNKRFEISGVFSVTSQLVVMIGNLKIRACLEVFYSLKVENSPELSKPIICCL